jgi:hypothetical protein
VPSGIGFTARPTTRTTLWWRSSSPSQADGRAFLEDPSLREAMERAGVVGEPHIHFREPVETVEY